MKRAARYIIFYAALLGLWTLLAELKIWPPYLFPTPWGVGEALYAGFADHTYWIAIRVSMARVLIGYGISVVLGMILASASPATSSWKKPWAVCWSACRASPASAGGRWPCSGSDSIRTRSSSS